MTEPHIVGEGLLPDQRWVRIVSVEGKSLILANYTIQDLAPHEQSCSGIMHVEELRYQCGERLRAGATLAWRKDGEAFDAINFHRLQRWINRDTDALMAAYLLQCIVNLWLHD